LSPEQARRLFASALEQAWQRDDFQEYFGYECVDAGFVPGTLGVAVAERLLLDLGHDNVWPAWEHTESWDDDVFFDMIEYLYDHVSSGVKETGQHHDYCGCGWHFSHFTQEPAQSIYRADVNRIISKVTPGYELSPDGRVVRSVPDDLAPLLESAPKLLDDDQRQHVAAAVTKYRGRASTPTDRRDAVRDLADVLENMRSSVKAHMPSKDEAALFEIANKFWIRHSKPDERRDYDHEAWWSWLFYVYLSSIALVSHLAARDDVTPE